MAQKKKAPKTVADSLKGLSREELVGMYEDMLTAVTFFAVAVAQSPSGKTALHAQLMHARLTAKSPEGRRASLVAATICLRAVEAASEKLNAKLAVRTSLS